MYRFGKRPAGNLLLGLLLTCWLATAQALTIVSTYRERTIESLLADFQRAHPDLRINILSRRSELLQRSIGAESVSHADVLLTSSPVLLRAMKGSGLLLQLPVPPSGRECAPPGIAVHDPDRRFLGYGFSGYGLLSDKAQLARRGAQAPASLQDLLQPIYHDMVLMSSPSRSGTTHLIVERILQDAGWEAGWRLLLQLGGNLRTIATRSFSVSESVLDGDAAVALVLDDYAMPLARPGSEFGFTYLPSFAVIPTYVAILSRGKDRAAALALVNYLFSQQGQANLLEPEHYKVPLNALPDNPGAQSACAMLRKQKPLDTRLVLERDDLVRLLFDQLITRHVEQLRDTWALIQLAERQPGLGVKQRADIERARRLASQVPVSASQAADPRYSLLFKGAAARVPVPQAVQEEFNRWNSAWTRQLDEATRLARQSMADRRND